MWLWLSGGCGYFHVGVVMPPVGGGFGMWAWLQLSGMIGMGVTGGRVCCGRGYWWEEFSVAVDSEAGVVSCSVQWCIRGRQDCVQVGLVILPLDLGPWGCLTWKPNPTSHSVCPGRCGEPCLSAPTTCGQLLWPSPGPVGPKQRAEAQACPKQGVAQPHRTLPLAFPSLQRL